MKIWMHFFGYLLSFILGGILSSLPQILFENSDYKTLLKIFSELSRIVITLIFLFCYTKYVVKNKELNHKMFNVNNISIPKWGTIGLVLPLTLMGITILLSGIKLINISTGIKFSEIILSLVLSGVIALASGILEEITFRGYMLEILHKKYFFWFSGLVPAIIFSLVHLGGTDSVFNGVQVLIGGVCVSIMFLSIYKVSNSIWNSCIVHGLWNFIILNQLISYCGKNSNYQLFSFKLSDNSILSGGNFGIEVSIIAILIYVIASIIIIKTNRKV